MTPILSITNDGRMGQNAAALAQSDVNGVYLCDYPNHVITVRTRNTTYRFTHHASQKNTSDGVAQWYGLAMKDDGEVPRYLATETPVAIHGSTWGGSMIRTGFIGFDMHLEFSTYFHDLGRQKFIITTPIEQIIVTQVNGVGDTRAEVEQEMVAS